MGSTMGEIRDDDTSHLDEYTPKASWHLPDKVIDVGLVTALTIIDLLATVLILSFIDHRSHSIVLILLGLLANIFESAALLWRRTRPKEVLATITALSVIVSFLRAFTRVFTLPLTLLVAIYSFALVARPSVMWKWSVLLWVSIFIPEVIIYNPNLSATLPLALMPTLVVGVGTSTGLFVGTRRKYIAQLQERTKTLEREQVLLTDQAVAAERVRIARELHDIISHHIALIVIQSGAAYALVGQDPEKARATISAMGETGRSALGEMRRMLGVLRTTDVADVPFDPSPGISELNDLIARGQDAGVSIQSELPNDLASLSEQYQLVIYRIVQESLTNVVKHAPRSKVSVKISRSNEKITVIVTNSGPIDTLPTTNKGHGISGMRERVELYGGFLETSYEENQFRIYVEIPLRELYRAS